MRCPYCSGRSRTLGGTKIIEKGKVKRFRQCKDCQIRFTTYELMDESYFDLVNMNMKIKYEVLPSEENRHS